MDVDGCVFVKGYVLIIINVIKVDIGVYLCKVVNFVGEVVVSFMLIIMSKLVLYKLWIMLLEVLF